MKETFYAPVLLPALSKVKSGKEGPARMSSGGPHLKMVFLVSVDVERD